MYYFYCFVNKTLTNSFNGTSSSRHTAFHCYLASLQRYLLNVHSVNHALNLSKTQILLFQMQDYNLTEVISISYDRLFQIS